MRPEGDAHAERPGAERKEDWPTPTYEDRRPEPSGQGMNATREFSAASQEQNSRLRCMGPEKRPCTEGEVRELSHRMAERSAEHPALASINTLTLESSQGAISCRQVDGHFCTPEQLRSLNEHVAEPLRYEIYELVLRSNPENRSSTAQNQTPTTSSEVSTTPDNASTTQSSTSPTPGSAYTMPSSTSPTPSTAYTTPSTAYTTPSSTSATSSSASTKPNNTSTKPTGNALTQGHNATAQNHAATTASHPPTWQHRPSAPQNHPSTAASQTSTPAKPQ